MRKLFQTFSLPIKIAGFYVLLNLLVFMPLNNFIKDNIGNFNTIYKDAKRLYDYDRMPDLSLSANWINKYSGIRPDTVIIIGDSKIEDYYVEYTDSIAAKLDRKLFDKEGVSGLGIPCVYNFGSSGSKTVYVMERIKKAAGYEPDLIIWQMGSGSYPQVKWAFSPGINASIYDISLGGGLSGAYSNIIKMNDQNASFISSELRGNLVPLARYQVFYARYFEGLRSSLFKIPLVYPEDRFITIAEGEGIIPYFEFPMSFDSSALNFDAVGRICEYVHGKGIPMMIYIDQIRSDVSRSKFEDGYYEKLVSAIRAQASPYGVHVLDLHDAVPDAYFVDGGHVKEKGNEIMASRLYEFILEYYSGVLFR